MGGDSSSVPIAKVVDAFTIYYTSPCAHSPTSTEGCAYDFISVHILLFIVHPSQRVAHQQPESASLTPTICPKLSEYTLGSPPMYWYVPLITLCASIFRQRHPPVCPSVRRPKTLHRKWHWERQIAAGIFILFASFIQLQINARTHMRLRIEGYRASLDSPADSVWFIDEFP